jgi:hypothetical protein
VVADKDKEYLYYKYATKSCLELYAYFFEHSINILSNKGVLSFITGSLYTKGIKFQPLRSFLENNTQLIAYRNEGDEVFKNVNMPTSTILMYKSNESKWTFDDLLLGKSNAILKKMDIVSKQLSDISIIQRGFEVGKNRVSNISGKYRFLTGSNVEKYCYKTVSYIEQDVVDEFQKDAMFYKGKRLLVRETGSYLTIVYLEEDIFCNRSLYSTIIKDNSFNVQYVVGILNSRPIQYYYQQKFKAETDLFPKIRIKQAKQLPIPIAPLQIQSTIAGLVEEIIKIKKNSLSSTEKLEREIDTIVYGNQGGDVSLYDSSSYANNIVNLCSATSYGKYFKNGKEDPTLKTLLTGDPKFKDYENGDYRLAAGSPCINNAYGEATTKTDLAGKKRVIGKAMDIGCYEFSSGFSVVVR